MMPNHRSALDARTALCLHTRDDWPGASESERSALAEMDLRQKGSILDCELRAGWLILDCPIYREKTAV